MDENIKHLDTLRVTSTTGVTLTAIRIPAGAYAGYPAAISKKVQVEFYDTRYNHTRFGQFTGGRYDVGTILTFDGRYGLNLYGDVREWVIDASELNRVKAWLKEF